MSVEVEKELSFCFQRSEVKVLECEGVVKLKVVASRRPRSDVSIRWTTEDGSAKCNPTDGTPARYKEASGELVFRHDDVSLSQEIEVTVIDDEQWEPTEYFQVTLENPMTVPGAHSGHRDVPRDMPQLGNPDKCKVYILNDDRPGFLSWDFPEVCTYPSRTDANVVTLYLSRRAGLCGEVTVDVNVLKASVGGKAASVLSKQSVRFDSGVGRQVVKVDLKQCGGDSKLFQVELANAKPEVCLKPSAEDLGEDWYKRRPSITSCQVEMLPSPKGFFARCRQRSDDSQPKEESSWEEWKGNFARAIYCKGSPDEQKEATYMDFLKHALSLPWKVLFSFVPPASMCGGWLAFFVALLMIGVLTAVVGDMATLLGCVVDIPDEITAITLVALGTSLPDTFASMIAAKTLDTCDDAIGNITGSNSVNVFLGLGIPWTIAAVYWHSMGEKFEVPAGSLSFSVMVFTGCAVVCIFILLLRRRVYGGELGGPKCATLRDSFLLCFLWVIYLTSSILKCYELI
jgi:solute carrier family 8 (sodium/calcium exchanger)